MFPVAPNFIFFFFVLLELLPPDTPLEIQVVISSALPHFCNLHLIKLIPSRVTVKSPVLSHSLLFFAWYWIQEL